MILALGLSGGAFLTLVNLANALLWRELPVHRPEELVGVSGIDRTTASWVNAGLPTNLAASLHGSGEIVGQFAGFHSFESVAVIDNVTQRVIVEGVNGGYFATLGMPPRLGRLLDTDDVDRASLVAAISFRFWQSRFGSDPGAIGRTFSLHGTTITIVGVAPPGFTGLQVGTPADLWVPTTLAPDLLYQPPSLIFFDALVTRLRPGATLQQARAAIEARWPAARAAAAEVVRPAMPGLGDYVLALEPRVDSAARGFSPYGAFYRSSLLSLLLICAIAIVLSCANLSGLLVARWSERETDLAVQAALGASRGRLAGQVVGESLVFAAVAVALSAPLALWSARGLALLVWNQPDVPPLELTPDVRVLAWMAAVVVIVTLGVSALPASRIWFGQHTLRPGARGSSARDVARWGRRIAVVQVALSVPLIATAWMVAANLRHLTDISTGFRPDEVIAVTLTPQIRSAAPDDLTTYLGSLAGATGALPGVSSAALASSEPVAQIGGPRRRPVVNDDGSQRAGAFVEQISPRYLATLGVALVAGRDFTWTDAEKQPAVAMVSQALATAVFGSDNPVGRRIRLADQNERAMEVIGVVTDANLAEPHQTNQLFLFVPYLQQPRAWLEAQTPTLLLRSSLSPATILPSIRRAVAALGRHDVLEANPLQQRIDALLIRERVIRLVSFYFAALATLLVFVGLLAVLNLEVTRRTPEIGVRIALGASPRDIRLLVIRLATAAAVAGLMVGVPFAFVCGRLAVRFLSLVAPADTAALAAAVALVLLICALATTIPLRRLSAINPAEALNRV